MIIDAATLANSPRLGSATPYRCAEPRPLSRRERDRSIRSPATSQAHRNRFFKDNLDAEGRFRSRRAVAGSLRLHRRRRAGAEIINQCGAGSLPATISSPWKSPDSPAPASTRARGASGAAIPCGRSKPDDASRSVPHDPARPSNLRAQKRVSDFPPEEAHRRPCRRHASARDRRTDCATPEGAGVETVFVSGPIGRALLWVVESRVNAEPMFNLVHGQPDECRVPCCKRPDFSVVEIPSTRCEKNRLKPDAFMLSP